jgi:hypothetical protein
VVSNAYTFSVIGPTYGAFQVGSGGTTVGFTGDGAGNLYFNKISGGVTNRGLMANSTNFIWGGITDFSTGQFQSVSTSQAQFALHFDATHYATLQVNSSGNLDIEHLTGLTINSGALPTGTTTDSVLVETTSANVATVKKVAQSSIGGSTPTFQQVLTAGSTLTGNNTIVLGTNTLTIGGGTFAGASKTNATFAHFVGNSTIPTIAAGSGAGSSPTVSVNGTDQDGLIVITTGTLPSGSTATIVTVTFSASFPNNTFITLTPANLTTAALTAAQVYPTGTTTNFSIISNVTALTAATQYSWFYHVGAN